MRPQVVGCPRFMSKKEGGLVVRRPTMAPESRRENRKQLVGLEALDAQTRIPVGGHVVDASFKAIPVRSQGWVTSAAMSPMLGHSIAMAQIENGPARIGESVRIFDHGTPGPELGRACLRGRGVTEV